MMSGTNARISTQRLSHALADESGSGTILSLYLIVVLLLLSAYTIDYSNGLRAKAQLQVVADGASITAARQLPDGPDAARQAALNYSQMYGANLLRAEDIHIGHWNGATFTTGNGAEGNAVSITTRRAEQNANALPTMLLFLVGRDQLDVSTLSIATIETKRAECSGGGYFARGHIIANSANRYQLNFCLHGQQSVNLHNVNRFQAGTIVSSLDEANIFAHKNNQGLDEAKRSASHNFNYAENLNQYIDNFWIDGINSTGLPAYIQHGPQTMNRIQPSFNPQPGGMYLVTGDADLRGNSLIERVAIIANGDVTIGSNVRLRDVVIATRGTITINNGTRIGGNADDYCERNTYSSYLLAQGSISFGSNNQLRGVFMATQSNVSMNSNNEATEGTYVIALGNISYNSASDKRACPTGYDNAVTFENEAMANALVR